MTGRYVIILWNALEEMGHPQPITQVYTENTTVTIIPWDTIKHLGVFDHKIIK